MSRIITFLMLAITLLGCKRQTEAPKPDVRGIVNYTYEPEVFTPKIYNWESMLTEEDAFRAEFLRRSMEFKPSTNSVRRTLNFFSDGNSPKVSIEKGRPVSPLDPYSSSAMSLRLLSPEAPGEPYQLFVEPGCAEVDVHPRKEAEGVYLFEIVGSLGGPRMVEVAKTTLGVTNNLFRIRFEKSKNPFSTNMIRSVTPALPEPGQETD